MGEAGQGQVRFVDETVVRLAELMTPDFENFAGKVHGGAILNFLDKVAYVCACRYAGTYSVTAAVESVEFREPVLVGELLHFTARVVYAGRTSMDVEILVESQELLRGTLRHTNTCHFTMVALKEGKPAAVPRLEARTAEDETRIRQAKLRRELRDDFRQRMRGLDNQ